jgi:hypothetical protein
MSRYTIDRFESGDWAVLEDERAQTFRIPKPWLPSEAREGDVLTVSEERGSDGGQSLRFELDPTTHEERLAEARRLRDQLPRGPKGDISL